MKTSGQPASRVRNDQFSSGSFDRGRSGLVEGCWYVCKILFLMSAIPWPSNWKAALLRFFGAEIGRGVYLKPRINVHFPWKLSIGDYTWIGEGTEIYNFEPISIGAHCCISQQALLCSGNHDYRDPTMGYRNAPIHILDGGWIGARTFIGPGVTTGVDAVATAGSLVVKDLPAGMVCSGAPCVPVRDRWR